MLASQFQIHVRASNELCRGLTGSAGRSQVPHPHHHSPTPRPTPHPNTSSSPFPLRLTLNMTMALIIKTPPYFGQHLSNFRLFHMHCRGRDPVRNVRFGSYFLAAPGAIPINQHDVNQMSAGCHAPSPRPSHVCTGRDVHITLTG